MNTTSQVSYWLAVLLLFIHSVVSDSLQPAGLQHARLPVLLSLLEFAQTRLLSQWCHPTISSCHLLLLLPSVFPSISIFSNESGLHIGWSKYGSFSFSPSNEYSALISFRTACVDIPAVQGTLKSPLQHHSSKASILRHSDFFMV